MHDDLKKYRIRMRGSDQEDVRDKREDEIRKTAEKIGVKIS